MEARASSAGNNQLVYCVNFDWQPSVLHWSHQTLSVVQQHTNHTVRASSKPLPFSLIMYWIIDWQALLITGNLMLLILWVRAVPSGCVLLEEPHSSEFRDANVLHFLNKEIPKAIFNPSDICIIFSVFVNINSEFDFNWQRHIVGCRSILLVSYGWHDHKHVSHLCVKVHSVGNIIACCLT